MWTGRARNVCQLPHFGRFGLMFDTHNKILIFSKILFGFDILLLKSMSDIGQSAFENLKFEDQKLILK